MADDALLIFPAGYGDGPAVAAQAKAAGTPVVGASSVLDDPAAVAYAAWTHLPHVTDPGFDEALAGVIEKHGIGRMHVTHFAAWTRLQDAWPAAARKVALTLGRSQLDIEADYRSLRARIAENRPVIADLAQASAPRPDLSAVEAAGFLRAAMAVPGESYEDKLLALIEVARRAPTGDIVELGSLFGRTASMFAMLAYRYGLGQILCVDPWSKDELEQGSEALLKASTDYAWDERRLAFEINVAPFANGRLNYIHATSHAGAPLYGADKPVTTEAFGATRYAGQIAILHIDGNHELQHVIADITDWTPHVAPGGWIIFDDYVWDWGDGPKIAGDAFVADPANRVRCSFVVGGALFVQIGG